MRLRFLKVMRLQQLRTLPILQCFFLLGTSMPLLPCPNLAEAVAVPPLNLIGAKGMTRTNAPLLADASRWLTPCANLSHANVVSTVKPINLYIMAIKKSKNKESITDFDNMMNEVEEELEVQQAEQDIVNQVPELNN